MPLVKVLLGLAIRNARAVRLKLQMPCRLVSEERR
jgi:hypothetical protein